MDAFEFLESLSTSTLEHLYKDPWVVQAVFQSCPPLAQQLIMRLLTCTTPIPQDFLQNWLISPRSVSNIMDIPPILHAALQKLLGLRVFQQVENHAFLLQPSFQEQLRLAISELNGAPWPSMKSNDQIDAVSLETYARGRWDTVLHFMVGSTAVPEPPQSIVDILLLTKLMQHATKESKNGKKALHITDIGYEFMLKDIHVQMWIFILEYIKTLDTSGAFRQEDILQFLFQISYCQTNVAYAVNALTSSQQYLLGDFVDFGLIYRPTSTSEVFYPTSLAVNLIFGGASGQMKATKVALTQSLSSVRAGVKSQPLGSSYVPMTSNSLQIVVETNFKVYAYTNSTLHVAMLSVFVDIVAKLPNLAIGFITRESLRSALIHGISAQQIYDFIMKHVHPKMRSNQPVIPENIADQLYLWERERNRVQFMEGMLFDGFNSQEEFNLVKQHAQDLKVLTWHDSVEYKLAISADGVEAIRQLLSKQNSMT